MKTKTKNAIERHGRELLAIFPNAIEQDPVKLCKRLRRIETSAHQFATAYCNGDVSPCEDSDIDAKTKRFRDRVNSILKNESLGIRVKINLDPRGYALKIESETAADLARHGKTLHRDWGGYGIIAPDLTEA